MRITGRTIPLEPVDIGANVDILAMLRIPGFIGHGTHLAGVGASVGRLVDLGIIARKPTK